MLTNSLHWILRSLILAGCMLFAQAANAAFHLWSLNELYSNASGTVQFIELTTTSGGQQFLSNHSITSTQGSSTHTYNFTTDLPGDSANRKFLIATQGFADLGIVTPDYVVPNGFLFLPNGSVNFADVDSISYSAMPSDGVHSLDRSGNNVANSPTNFAGVSGSIGATVTASYAQALFVNASTSSNKTSVLRVVNPTASSGILTATAYDENGNLLGNADSNLGSIAANQSLTFSSANLETLLGFTPSAPTAKYSIYFTTTLASVQLINSTRDNATGALTLSQPQYADRSVGASTGSVTRSAWFISSSTSTNKTNVLRIINTSGHSGTLTASLYDEDGILFGSGHTQMGPIGAHQMLTYTSAQLENAIGFNPISTTAKYRVVFSADVSSMELINFTKDHATGNLALVQAQMEDRPGSSAASSTRNVLSVYPSTSTVRNTVLRIVNPNSSSATVTAVAYDEAGSAVGSGMLGTVAANQILALTSAQIETALAYSPSSANAKYRLVVEANVPTFEVIGNTKAPSTGNLYLAQAQTDNRVASSTGSSTRNVYLIYPSGNSTTTTELRIINTTALGAVLTATAYDDSGTVIAANATLATIAANQMLSYTSTQLEALFGYAPAAGARWRLVISGGLSNFEVLNYAKDVASGLLVLAQPQTE